MAELMLEAKMLSCTRDDRALFDTLSFTISAGAIVQIEGPNGAGKTTLLRILSGLMQNFSGTIYFNGNDVADYPEEWVSNLVYLGHLAGIKLQLNALENLRWIFALTGSVMPAESDIMAALSHVGLAGFEDVACNSLSAGQKRRVALARLFLEKKPVWILDEPFTAIDKKGVAKLETQLIQHADQGGIVILTTHQDVNFPSLHTIRLGQ